MKLAAVYCAVLGAKEAPSCTHLDMCMFAHLCVSYCLVIQGQFYETGSERLLLPLTALSDWSFHLLRLQF